MEKKCDKADGRNSYMDQFAYLYMRQDGSTDGWQFVNNNKRMPFEKTWFKVRSKGRWTGQPWFKCIERCEKLVNMK